MTNNVNKEVNMQFRVTPTEKLLIKRAVALKGKNSNQSEYLRKVALKQAEIDLANQTTYNVNKEDMDVLLSALESPAVKNAELARLLKEKTIFE